MTGAKVKRVVAGGEDRMVYVGPENPAMPPSTREGRVLMFRPEDLRREAQRLARIRFLEADGVLPALFDLEDSLDIAIRGSIEDVAADDRTLWATRACNEPEPVSAEDFFRSMREAEKRRARALQARALVLLTLAVGVIVGLLVRLLLVVA